MPVATVKYYLREGLLPPGVTTSATRAEYGPAHLRRLGLIRALLEIGEVPLAAIRKILAVTDNEAVSVHEMLGSVQCEFGPHPAVPPPRTPSGEGSRVALAESAVVGMVLYERVIVALRRLAQEDASARYFG